MRTSQLLDTSIAKLDAAAVTRHYDTLDVDVEAAVRLDRLLGLCGARASRADLLERRLGPLSGSDGAYRIPTKGFAIETIRWDVPQ